MQFPYYYLEAERVKGAAWNSQGSFPQALASRGLRQLRTVSSTETQTSPTSNPAGRRPDTQFDGPRRRPHLSRARSDGCCRAKPYVLAWPLSPRGASLPAFGQQPCPPAYTLTRDSCSGSSCPGGRAGDSRESALRDADARAAICKQAPRALALPHSHPAQGTRGGAAFPRALRGCDFYSP